MIDIDAIKSLDMKEVVESFGSEVKRGGFILCPKHLEKTESCKIYESNLKCFGCGWRGDAIDYVMASHKLDFKEAAQSIARQFGLVVGDGESDHEHRQRMERLASERQEKEAERELEAKADKKTQIRIQTAFVAKLSFQPDNPGARYLDGRCIPFDIAQQAGCKWISDPNRASAWLKSNYPLEALQAAGLFNTKGNFRLWGHRLVFPYQHKGQIMGMQGRDITGERKPKELTIGRPHVPFNIDLIDGAPIVFMTEGVIDCLSVLALNQAAIGIPGTSSFKPEWANLLTGKTVNLRFDGDPAGRLAAIKIEDILRQKGIRAYASPMPESTDLNQYLTLSNTRRK